MSVIRIASIAVCLLALGVSPAVGNSVNLKISGPGAVNDSTIKTGENVCFDVYVANDTIYTGFSFGFSIESSTIKKVIHVADSGKGLNDAGDIKGHNGWNDQSIWDFGGVFTVEKDWDGQLPELLGFGGLCVKKQYQAHDAIKVLSFEMMFPEAGTFTVDSSFFPPGGRWLFAAPPPGDTDEPKWAGPYKYTIVK